MHSAVGLALSVKLRCIDKKLTAIPVGDMRAPSFGLPMSGVAACGTALAYATLWKRTP